MTAMRYTYHIGRFVEISSIIVLDVNCSLVDQRIDQSINFSIPQSLNQSFTQSVIHLAPHSWIQLLCQ